MRRPKKESSRLIINRGTSEVNILIRYLFLLFLGTLSYWRKYHHLLSRVLLVLFVCFSLLSHVMFSFKFIIIIVDLQLCIILCPLCCLAHLIDEFDHCERQRELMINAPDSEFCKFALISGQVIVL